MQVGFLVGVVLLIAVATTGAEVGYRLPPKSAVDVLDAPAEPYVLPAPDGRALLLVDYQPWPSISVISRPFLGLAGLRIDPGLSCLRRVTLHTGLTVIDVRTQVASRIELPAGIHTEVRPVWSPDSSAFAFTQDTDQGIRLWIGDRATCTARMIPGVLLTDILEAPMRWWTEIRLCW